MYIKLDIEITFIDKFAKDGIFNEYNKILGIKVHSIDKRFQVFNCIKSNELFISKDGMRILSTLEVPLGGIHNHAIILPNPKHTGITMYREFLYDFERMNYLRKLYGALYEWSNNWWGFNGDEESKIIVNDNRWTIECGKRNEIFVDNDVELNDVY